MNQKKFFPLLVLGFILAFASCVPNKKIIYLQDMNQTVDTIYPVQPNNYRLQKGDIIGIDVKISTDNRALAGIFSIQNNQGVAVSSAGGQGGGDYYYLTGYILDDSGSVSLPIVGKIKLEGHSIFEANQVVQARFDEYLNETFVSVRLGGLRFSVLGEVRRPGKYMVFQNKMTIFEAIANSGDLTEMAKRDAIVIMRQYPDGTRIHKLNLLDENVISSPFYYIQPNDVIYVEPLSIRSLGTGTTGLATIASILTILSSAVIIFSLVR